MENAMQFDFEFRSRRSNIMGKRGMVASSQPLATLAGLDILRAGGNAADAAVATAAMLNVVEPFSTGIGGDCFVLYFESSTKSVHGLNGSGPAAQSADLERLKRAGFSRHPLYTGQAVSVPGAVGAWSALLERFGRMSFSDVLTPAIQCAFEGYAVTEWIGSAWHLMEPRLKREKVNHTLPKYQQFNGPAQPSGYEFLVDGRPLKAGDWIALPTLGETLKQLAAEGKDFFYQGDFAQRLCQHVQKYDGWLQPADLAGYEAEWVEPLYADYHGVRLYECPPNGQGLAAIMAVKIAEGFDFAKMDWVQRTHTLIECMRLGFLEALRYVADPLFNDLPYEKLMSEAYLQNQRELIDPNRAIENLPIKTSPVGEDTVYLSVVDCDGNACSFINSLYIGGGTGLVVPGTGVLLQNRAGLFSLDPAHPNALEGGKRPYHTIIPAMLTQNGELLASFGVMGGFMQPQGHLQVLSNLVDLGHNPQQALDMPRFCLKITDGDGVGANDPGGEVYLEKGFDFDQLAALRLKGHHIEPLSGWQRILFGGGQIIQRDPQTGILTAGSDPRKDGCALGY
jgi:gamma-glutamyltranspeptidase/glutathione hydrolase